MTKDIDYSLDDDESIIIDTSKVKKIDPPEQKEVYISKERGGVPTFESDMFTAVKEALTEHNHTNPKTVRFSQPLGGTRINFFRGNLSNNYGYIEAIEKDDGKTVYYTIKIYNSYLKEVLRKHPKTAEFFKDVL